MQRLDLQFYSFFTMVLSGVVLGLLFDLLRVIRSFYQPGRWIGAGADLLFWIAGTGALAGGLFAGNWGEIRFYVVVGIILGLGLYYGLASALVMQVFWLVLRVLEWLYDLIVTLLLRLVWAPLVALAGLLLATGRLLWRWLEAFAGGVWGAVLRLFGWALRPFMGPYRCVKLHYLLTKRRVKRWLRAWLLGPPPRRRR